MKLKIGKLSLFCHRAWELAFNEYSNFRNTTDIWQLIIIFRICFQSLYNAMLEKGVELSPGTRASTTKIGLFPSFDIIGRLVDGKIYKTSVMKMHRQILNNNEKVMMKRSVARVAHETF